MLERNAPALFPQDASSAEAFSCKEFRQVVGEIYNTNKVRGKRVARQWNSRAAFPDVLDIRSLSDVHLVNERQVETKPPMSMLGSLLVRANEGHTFFRGAH